MRILLGFFKSMVVFALFLIALGYYLLFTNSGAEVVVKVLAKSLPGELQVQNVQGNLASEMRLQEITFSNKSTHVFIESLNWSLRSATLKQKKFIFDTFEMTGVRINLIPDDKNTGKLNWDELTHALGLIDAVQIYHLHIKDFIVSQKNKIIYQFDQLLINKQTNNNSLSLSTPNGRVNGEFTFRSLPLILSSKLTLDGKLGNFPVKGAAFFHYANNQLEIKNTQIKIADAQLKVDGKLDQTWNIQWQLKIPKLETIVSTAQGSLKSVGKLTGRRDAPQLIANLEAENISYDDIKIKKVSSEISSKLPSHHALPIHANLSISDLKISDYQLPQAKLQIVTEILPEKISAHENPFISAHTKLEEGRVLIPQLHLSLESLTGMFDYKANQPIIFSANFISGKGKANLSGQFNPHDNNVPLTMHLNGTNLTIADLNEYKIIVSPALDFSYYFQVPMVRGQINIPFAEIKPKDFTNVTTLPSEVVIVDRKKKSTPFMPMYLDMNVKVSLGDHVALTYENLQTRLQGSVTVTQRPGSLPIGSGELHSVEGKYRAYGKLLTIKQGRIIYTGNPIMNPGLDIRAAQQFNTLAYESSDAKFNDAAALESVYTGSSNTLTAGIWVKGTLNHPTILLYSDPAGLDQSDILSYLVFGYPRSKIKDANKLGLLNSIASGLYSEKTNTGSITNKVQNYLGLTEFDIGSKEYFDPSTNSTGSATSVTVGKKIGKNLSLRYSVGIFDSVSVFNLRYQINKRLSIQSEKSSLDTGADILYEFEKD